MSGHEFEKQVRQKLNDLKMTPSSGAWENIENSLRERKRRPVAFYWVPLLLIGLAAGGYLFLNNDQKTILSDKNSTPNVHAQTKVTEEKTISPQKKSTAAGSVLNDNVHQKVAVLQRAVIAGQKKSSANDDAFSDVQQEKSAAPVGVLKDEEQQNTNAVSGKTLFSRNFSLKISNYPVGTITPSPLNFKQTPKVSPLKKQSKWSYGLSAFAGISAVSQGHIFNFNNALVEDVSRVPAFAPRPSYKPSSISPGFAYSGGLFVKRELSKRFSLSLGVNYLQLNTRNKVGDRQVGNQIVNAGFTGYVMVSNSFRVEVDNKSDYHNRFHFVEVPVELHTKLNKSQKIPLHLTTGVAVSQLLKSNSLHFDGTTGVYYKDDRLVNQTQVAAKAGVSIGILNKTTRPLWIGPSARYNISKILDRDVSARTNFMSIGVDVKMFIK